MSNRFNTDCQIQGDTFIDQIIQNPVKFNSNGPSHNLNLSESNFHSGASLLSKLVNPETAPVLNRLEYQKKRTLCGNPQIVKIVGKPLRYWVQ